MGEKFLRCILLLNLSFIDEHYTACHFPGKSHLMCDNHHRHSISGKFFHNLKYFSYHFRIKCRSRLIKQHHIRIHSKCTRNRNTLLLSSGKHCRIDIRFIRKPYAYQQFICTFRSLFFCHEPGLYRGKHDIPFYGMVGKEIKLLKHHSDFLTHFIDVNGRIRNIRSLKKNGTGGWFFQKIHGAQKRRFSASRRSDNCNNLSLRNRC